MDRRRVIACRLLKGMLTEVFRGRVRAYRRKNARVQECGLIALAGAVGVSRQNDWGKYLAAIDAELQNRLTLSGPKNPDDQFYAEGRITFDAVRRAWRNPTMHVEKTYTMERAEEIMISVKQESRTRKQDKQDKKAGQTEMTLKVTH
jgi:hypothetical protein